MEAKINKVTLIFAILGVIVCVAVGAWALTDPLGRSVAIFCFGFFALIVGLGARAIIISVKRVSAEGLERGDGRRFKWADLKEVKDFGYRGHGVRETKLRFKEGRSALLSRTYLSNYDQLRSYVDSMTHARGGGNRS